MEKKLITNATVLGCYHNIVEIKPNYYSILHLNIAMIWTIWTLKINNNEITFFNTRMCIRYSKKNMYIWTIIWNLILKLSTFEYWKKSLFEHSKTGHFPEYISKRNCLVLRPRRRERLIVSLSILSREVRFHLLICGCLSNALNTFVP